MVSNKWIPVTYESLKDEDLVYQYFRHGIKFAQNSELNPEENHIWVSQKDLNFCQNWLNLSSFVPSIISEESKAYWDIKLDIISSKLAKCKFYHFPES